MTRVHRKQAYRHLRTIRYPRIHDGFDLYKSGGLAYGTLAGDRGTHHPELLGS